MRLSKLTDYAIVILSYMAKQDGHTLNAIEMANATKIALPTVSKILKLLVNAGVLNSVRGAKGGYGLASKSTDINIASIIHAMEGPIALTECSLSRQGCEQAAGCDIHANWNVINQTIQQALESVTLADMIRPAPPVTETFIPVATLRGHDRNF